LLLRKSWFCLRGLFIIWCNCTRFCQKKALLCAGTSTLTILNRRLCALLNQWKNKTIWDGNWGKTCSIYLTQKVTKNLKSSTTKSFHFSPNRKNQFNDEDNHARNAKLSGCENVLDKTMFPFLLIHNLFLFQNSLLPSETEHEKKVSKTWPEIVFVPEEEKVAY